MSFLGTSHRAYDPADLSQSHLPSPHHPNTRPPMHPFDNHPIQLPAISTSSLPSTAPQHSPATDRSPIILPRLGQTRCYWSLLTPDLAFLYLDPVFASHLHEQADLLVGESLLSFVHPDEQDTAKRDLGGVLESRTLHGSVTRVRFSRMSRVRRQLGYQGPAQEWADSDIVAVDSNYMAIDIVINWAADGLVLCFMHAAVDLSSRDNDEHNKTNWTNWCSTPHMSMDQVNLLYQRLLSAIPQSQPPTMSRVFQILLNQPDRPLLLSWPPDQDQEGPTSKDFVKLAKDVQINATSGGTDARTSCMRRYKALHQLPSGVGGTKEVESIFILHGAIIFACHKVDPTPRSSMSSNGAQQPGYGSHSYTPQSHSYYEQPSHSYSLPPVPAPHSYNPYASQPPPPPQYPSNSWPRHEPSGSQAPYGQWAPPSNSFPPSSVSSLRSSSYPAPQPQHHWSSQPPSYMDTSAASSSAFSQSLPSPGAHYSGSASGNERASPSPGSDIVPASRTQRRGSASTREQYGSGGRSSGNPPVGIVKCSSCKVTHSPEWRKGPSGKKDLCNACGLRYARSRAKKEGGGLSQRRRKDRTFGAMSSKNDTSPSASPVSAPYAPLRRSSMYDDHSFVSGSSAGSPSGSEMYPPHGGHGFNGMTPSPSPPSGNVSYQYPPPPPPPGQNDHRSHFGGTFYSVPPPPPLPPSALLSHNHHAGAGAPRLDPIVPYPSRISPLVSPSSPASDSPLSGGGGGGGGGLSAASFERERHELKDRERVLPPTPVSAEPRHLQGKPSFLSQ